MSPVSGTCFKGRWNWIKLPFALSRYTQTPLPHLSVSLHPSMTVLLHPSLPPSLSSPPPLRLAGTPAWYGPLLLPLPHLAVGTFYWEKVKWLRMSTSVYTFPWWCPADAHTPPAAADGASESPSEAAPRHVPLKVSGTDVALAVFFNTLTYPHICIWPVESGFPYKALMSVKYSVSVVQPGSGAGWCINSR